MTLYRSFLAPLSSSIYRTLLRLALPHVLNPLVLLHELTPLALFDVLSLLLFLLVLVVTSSPGHSKFWILPYSHMGHCSQPGITLHWLPSLIGPRKIT